MHNYNIVPRLWRSQFQWAIFQLISVLMLRKMAICQLWLKKRHDLRKKCRINVSIGHNYQTMTAVMSNISSNGARIEGRLGLIPNDKVKLQFGIHYLESPVEILGTVMWVKGESSGIRFD